MAKPKLSRDQKETLGEIIESPALARKVDENEFDTLTKAQWNKIFQVISASIEYFASEDDDDSQDWYRDLYGDVEKVMRYYHPAWNSPGSLES